MKLGGVATIMMASILLASCSKESKEPEETKKALATVNGKPVYQEHIDAMLGKFPPEAVAKSGDDIEQKILESLVRAKAVAELARQTLSENETENIKLRAELYQEELLAAGYLKDNATIEPVTGAMVRDYYEKNRHRYSLGDQVHIQYLQSESGLEEGKKRALMKALSSVSAEADWKAYKKELEADGYPVFYRNSSIKESLLASPLDSIVASLDQGEASSVFYGDTLYRVRLLEKSSLGYQPLSEVSAEIRRKLAPVQMKKAVKLVSDEALKSVNVEYLNH